MPLSLLEKKRKIWQNKTIILECLETKMDAFETQKNVYLHLVNVAKEQSKNVKFSNVKRHQYFYITSIYFGIFGFFFADCNIIIKSYV